MRKLVLSFALSCCAAAAVSAETLVLPQQRGHLEGELLEVRDARHLVLLIPGAGPTDRDGNGLDLSVRSDSYRLLAEALHKEGVSSLRIDKRGQFGSASALDAEGDVTIVQYAADARQWAEVAAHHARCVWLAGHSEGGLVALLAATENPPADLCGVILLAAAGRPADVLMLEQIAALPERAEVLAELTELVEAIKAGGNRDPDLLSPVLQPLFSANVQRFMGDLFSYTPTELAKEWRGPTLIVQGTADLQVRGLDADLLQAAMPQAVRLDLEGATHMLKLDVPGHPIASYTEPSLPLHPALVPGIVDFIVHQVVH